MEIRIPSGAKIQPFFVPVEVLEIGQGGMPGELIIHNGKLYVYSALGATMIDGGMIQTEAILAGSITADKLTIGSLAFTHNITWTATDEDTCSWSSGTIKWADGETSEIDGGNTGDIATTTFIYYDGTSTLKTTTNYANAISDTKRLLAIVEKAESGGKCAITLINSSGTTIDGNKIVTGKIQSTDGKTYFDLNENRLIVNDGDDDVILVGKK